MKRTVLIKQGKIGRNNYLARKKIAEIAENLNIDRCEIGLEGCLEYYALAPAHRHRREWYRGDVDKLSDYQQWICGCSNCHEKIDNDEELKEKIFNELRPK